MAPQDKSDQAKRESTPGGATGSAGLGSAADAPDAPRAQAGDRSAPEWLSEYRVGPDGRVRSDVLVMAMSEDSFPCSDPPSFTPGPIGAPTR